MSPFLLMDYAGPTQFPVTDKQLGVGQHPHRGFETVTIVYKGGVSHKDSSGGGGSIGPGDVQRMTAASGIIYEEFHSPEFAATGGDFEMIQLWVNLPAKEKMSSPSYQGILERDITAVDLGDGAGSIRVIAGDYLGIKGAASTFTPMNVWDIRLNAGHSLSLNIADGHTCALFLLAGELAIGDSIRLHQAELAVMTREGDRLKIDATTDCKLLLLSGEPINEPIVGHGPFVMNTREEITQAIRDFQNGRFGNISH